MEKDQEFSNKDVLKFMRQEFGVKVQDIKTMTKVVNGITFTFREDNIRDSSFATQVASRMCLDGNPVSLLEEYRWAITVSTITKINGMPIHEMFKVGFDEKKQQYRDDILISDPNYPPADIRIEAASELYDEYLDYPAQFKTILEQVKMDCFDLTIDFTTDKLKKKYVCQKEECSHSSFEFFLEKEGEPVNYFCKYDGSPLVLDDTQSADPLA